MIGFDFLLSSCVTAPETMEVNPEYEPQSNQELMDSLTNWVHHVKYILPQVIWILRS